MVYGRMNGKREEEEDTRIRFIEEWMGNEKKKKILEYGLWKNEWETRSIRKYKWFIYWSLLI